MLLLDEPLGALDLKLRQEMQIELKRIQQEVGITFVYVTHDQEEALTMSDRIAVFSQGRIDQIGTPAEVYERPANEFVAGVRRHLEPARAGRPAVHDPAGEDHDLGDGRAAGDRVERGTIRESLYAGPVTRTVVDLEQGGEVVVVSQNSAGPPVAGRARPARSRSRGARTHTFAIEGRTKEDG